MYKRDIRDEKLLVPLYKEKLFISCKSCASATKIKRINATVINVKKITEAKASLLIAHCENS